MMQFASMESDMHISKNSQKNAPTRLSVAECYLKEILAWLDAEGALEQQVQGNLLKPHGKISSAKNTVPG